MKPIPGAFAAYSLLLLSSLLLAGSLAGAVWLTGLAAAWIGGALPI